MNFNEKDKRISDIKLIPYGWERFDVFRASQMKTLNSMINLIDPSEGELLGASVHGVALLLARGAEKASEKERNSEGEVLDEYLI